MDHTHIEKPNELARYREQLSQRRVATIAMDFEGEFNLHQYGEKLCLIQIFDGAEFATIDPFGLSPTALKDFLESRNILKIMYDSLSDQALVGKQYDAEIASILDIRPAVELLEYPKKDLSSVIHQALGVELSTKKKFQRYNWTRRPLSEEAVSYALSDVAYLFQLKDRLLAELIHAGLIDAYFLANLRLQGKSEAGNQPPRLLRSNRVKKMSADKRKRFEQLFALRDEVARELNLPPNSVIQNEDLFALAAGDRAPQDLTFNPRVPTQHRHELVKKMSEL
ncbi:MAG: HRDC domain-containing protein [Spirochaetota bacterium]